MNDKQREEYLVMPDAQKKEFLRKDVERIAALPECEHDAAFDALREAVMPKITDLPVKGSDDLRGILSKERSRLADRGTHPRIALFDNMQRRLLLLIGSRRLLGYDGQAALLFVTPLSPLPPAEAASVAPRAALQHRTRSLCCRPSSRRPIGNCISG